MFKVTGEIQGVKHIKLKVEDNGQGIEESSKEQLFDMFRRWNEKSQGSGLGLYAVKMALEKLHGKIKVLDSQKGAAFEIVIPNY